MTIYPSIYSTSFVVFYYVLFSLLPPLFFLHLVGKFIFFYSFEVPFVLLFSFVISMLTRMCMSVLTVQFRSVMFKAYYGSWISSLFEGYTFLYIKPYPLPFHTFHDFFHVISCLLSIAILRDVDVDVDVVWLFDIYFLCRCCMTVWFLCVDVVCLFCLHLQPYIYFAA